MKYWKKLAASCIALTLSFCLSEVSIASPAKAKDTKPGGPEIDAEAAIVMDADSGAILYQKNMDKKEYPASITKIMTSLLAIENSSPEDTVTFSHDAVFTIEPGSSHIGMRENEKLSMDQSLHALLMASANEVANAISEHVGGGSRDKFIQMMNDRAKEIGCKNTSFQNPHGLHNDNHYTTAYDMALITKEALKHEKFREIISTYSYEIPGTNLIKEKRVFQNHHGMLPQCKYPYEGCIGGKTGFTSMAGHTLVTCAERNGMTLICVIMKSGVVCYNETKELLNYGFNSFRKVSAYDDMSTRKDAYTKLLKKAKVKVKASAPYLTVSENSYILLPSNYTEDNLKMEFTEGTTEENSGKNSVGQITVTYNDAPVGTVPIITSTSKDTSIIKGILPKKDTDKINKAITKKGGFSFTFSIVLMLILLLLAVLICFYYNRKRR